ncbi:hypothetical protein HPB48_009610 [Haemaphysalis longicornis]|uniref:Uncharacterized protein n=1 Tax=Haemaphysalis longicornis TaxID=44386 RepID=A0A9J6FTX1_HAELO|nr:hypothetical protein HPB48_009610 [Haemaphysalis longicornis]
MCPGLQKNALLDGVNNRLTASFRLPMQFFMFGSAYKATFVFQLASSVNVIKAGYMLSYYVAKQMELPTICETRLFPYMKDVVGTALRKENVEKNGQNTGLERHRGPKNTRNGV